MVTVTSFLLSVVLTNLPKGRGGGAQRGLACNYKLQGDGMVNITILCTILCTILFTLLFTFGKYNTYLLLLNITLLYINLYVEVFSSQSFSPS